MNGWDHVRVSDLRAGDHIEINRRGYGRREGRLGERRTTETGEWYWPDVLGKPLLDPWWATGDIQRRVS